jgi:hypothetical protein
MRFVGLAVAAALLAGCSMFVAPPPSSVPAPREGESPAVGVNYRVSPSCPAPLQVGTTIWVFEMTGRTWPPAEPKYEYMLPYPVPGVISLSSDTAAVFRADVNGEVIPMTRDDSAIPDGCL